MVYSCHYPYLFGGRVETAFRGGLCLDGGGVACVGSRICLERGEDACYKTATPADATRSAMTTRKTATGRILTDADLDAIAEEVETSDYDIDTLRKRRRGRPAMGSGPAEVVPVRIDPELRAAVTARAETDGTTTSEVIREALRSFLDVKQAEQPQHA